MSQRKCSNHYIHKASRKIYTLKYVRLGHVGFVVDKVALKQVFSKSCSFLWQFSLHQMFHIHETFYHRSYILSIVIASLNNQPHTTCQNKYVWITPILCKQEGTRILYLGFEVLTVTVMKSSIFWGIMPCSLLKANWHFRGICHLHLQGWRISHTWHQQEQ
jgi:hypothetical protein